MGVSAVAPRPNSVDDVMYHMQEPPVTARTCAPICARANYRALEAKDPM